MATRVQKLAVHLTQLLSVDSAGSTSWCIGTDVGQEPTILTGELSSVRPMTVTKKANLGDQYMLLVSAATPATAGTIVHCGQEARLSEATATLLRSDVPFRIDTGLSGALAIAAFETSDLLSREPRLHSLSGHTLTGTISATLRDMIGDPATHRAGNQAAHTGLINRLTLAAGVELDKRPGSAFGAAELNRLATEIINRRCVEPSLRSLDIADELGLSVRQLESMFKRRRMSTLEAIASARIALVRMALNESAFVDLEAIAHSCGFYDVSHLQRSWTKATRTSLGDSVATGTGQLIGSQ